MRPVRTWPGALLAGLLSAILSASFCPPALAFKKVEFAWPVVGSAQLSISGNTYDLVFAETVNLTAKTDIALNLNLGKWRHNLTMNFVLKNGNLPAEGVLKLGSIGFFLDRWRLVSTYERLTLTAGDTAAPNVFTKYMSGSSLYGASIQVGGNLPWAKKDTDFTISGMGGKNSTGRGISSTTLDVAGLALELMYKKALTFNAQFLEGIREGTDIKVGAAMLGYAFDSQSITLDAAVSDESFSKKAGWYGSAGYAGNFQRKVALSANLSYTSEGFRRLGASSPSNGGALAANANLTWFLTPGWKGSETLGLAAKYSKDNLEGTKASSQQSATGSVTYAASGFAPSTSASASYAVTFTSNDAVPKEVDNVKHELSLKYNTQASINSSRLTLALSLAPSATFNRVKDDVTFNMTNSISSSLNVDRTTVTGKAELKVNANKLTSKLTIAPSMDLNVTTSFAKPAISLSAVIKVSNSSTIQYDTGTITSNVSYLDVQPGVTWKVSDSFSVYGKYAGKLRFGASTEKPLWTDTFGIGISFKL